MWNQTSYPVIYSAQLQSANSDLTTNLLQANYYSYTVLAELNALQALGAQGITFHINFPALYEPYYTNPSDYQSYLSFYTTLVNEIRSRGLKLTIESTIAIVYPGDNSGTFVPYYQSLDWPTYEAQRAALVASIAQLLKPDYLVVIEEPDTEANSTGQANADTVSGSTDMLQQMLAAIQANGVTSVQVGAGCGTWDPNFLGFIQSFSTLAVNFVDLHVYPVNENNLPNALTALGIIQASGKPPTMSEFWPYKESDEEYNEDLSYTTIYARDAYSFWSPVDISFLQMMSDFGNYGHFVFMTPFWSHYYAAYLDFNTYGSLPDATVITDSDTASTNANFIGAFTPTGHAYESIALKGAVDTTPPSTPAAPTLVAYSQTAATLSWTPSTDNVAVAAYNIYRGDEGATPIATVSAPLTYTDKTLTASTTYTYTIAAFDASSNLSAQSPPLTVTTYANPDHTPPSVPQGLVVKGSSDTSMSLTWLPSTDNVAVLGYKIFRGPSQGSLSVYALSSTNSFTDTSLAPSATFYYQVEAYDAWYNYSAPSKVAYGTTLADSTPPTVPANVTVTAPAANQAIVTWSASQDSFMVTGYQVYRGNSATSLHEIAWSTTLSYTDSTVSAGKIYYYSVVAQNYSKVVSAQSTPVSVTTP